MSRKIIIISIFMMLLGLTACTKKFDEDDVKNTFETTCIFPPSAS